MRCLCRRVAPAIVAVYCCLAALAFAADTGSRLPPPVAAALANAGIPDSSVGIFVQDVQTAQAVVAVGEDRALNPASTIKLLTTFAALDQLGPAYQWATEIYADGTLTGDVLNGNLVLKGYGDPRLTLENFWLMLRNLRARGVREIRGDLVLDRRYFAREDADPAEFDNEPTRPYNTPPDALLVNFKALRLQFLPDAERQVLKIIAEPALPQVQILNNITLDNERCDDWVGRLKLTAVGDRAGARLLFSGNYSVACGEKSATTACWAIRSMCTGCSRCYGGNWAARSAAASATAPRHRASACFCRSRRNLSPKSRATSTNTATT